MKLYKLTTQDGLTQAGQSNETRWAEGVNTTSAAPIVTNGDFIRVTREMCQCGYRIIHADGSPAEPFQPGPQDRDECIAQARERFGNLPVAADDTPAVDWNNWALLRDALTVHPMPKGSIGQLCAMRLQQLVGDQPQGGISRGGRTFIISTNDGHWGRGKYLHEAAQAALKAGARRPSLAFLSIVLNDGTAEINEAGNIVADSISATIAVGRVGTVGGILNAHTA
jgi:hypothetical protein